MIGSNTTANRGPKKWRVATCLCQQSVSTVKARAVCWPTSIKPPSKSKKFEGNQNIPAAVAATAPKRPATHNQIYDPERILYPLKRVGKRGEGKWKRISWDQALEEIETRCGAAAKRLDGIMYHVGRPVRTDTQTGVFQAWGVDGHNSHTNICSSGARAGYFLWGAFDRSSPDHANARTILLISSHLETGHYFNHTPNASSKARWTVRN